MAQKMFMELAAHPQAILDAMDSMRPAIQKAERRQKWMRLINPLRIALIIIGIIIIILGYALIGFILIIIPFASFFLYSPQKQFPKSRFEAAYQLIHTLRDDVGRKGRLVGHLDLSPPNQKTKVFREGKTSSGRPKTYYRDPWFVARLKLVDGSAVKLLLEDRIKEKRGSFVYHNTLYENKIIVNPGIYIADYRHDPSRPEVLVKTGTMDAKNLQVRGVLDELKYQYDKLRPLKPQAVSPPPPAEAAPAAIQPPDNPTNIEPQANP